MAALAQLYQDEYRRGTAARHQAAEAVSPWLQAGPKAPAASTLAESLTRLRVRHFSLSFSKEWCTGTKCACLSLQCERE